MCVCVRVCVPAITPEEEPNVGVILTGLAANESIWFVIAFFFIRARVTHTLVNIYNIQEWTRVWVQVKETLDTGKGMFSVY